MGHFAVTPVGGRTAKALLEAKPVRGRQTVVVGVRMTVAMRDRVKQAADYQGVTVSEWMEWLVETQLLRRRR